jgi:hypothetical protein
VYVPSTGPGDYEVRSYTFGPACPEGSLTPTASWLSDSWQERPVKADGVVRIYQNCVHLGTACGRADVLFDLGCEKRRLLVDFEAPVFAFY